MRRGRRIILVVAATLAFAGAAVSQTRSITVASEPGAKVFIDGILYGKTGEDGHLQIKSVATGAHTLMLRSDGFKEKAQPLAVTARGEIRVPLVKTTDEAELAFQEAERLSSQDREKAIAAYQRAVKLRPNYPEAYVAMARV
ncbi:MAG: tetratricopeptide repeat protein, partial [Pyrinomonadaceae bacterium]